jgi:hypothetical protein
MYIKTKLINPKERAIHLISAAVGHPGLQNLACFGQVLRMGQNQT